MLSFRKGDIVHSDEPYSTVVHDSFLDSICSCCFSKVSPSKANFNRCFACDMVTYCSTSCQLDDADDHENECKLINASLELPNEHIRLILRTATRYLREKEAGQLTVGDYFGHKRTFDDLLSHVDEIEEEELLRSFDIARNIKKCLKNSGTYMKAKQLLIIMLKICVNAHSIVDTDAEVEVSLGAAVYLAASKNNHTCEDIEDYIQLFDKKRIYLKALRDFEVEDPLDICTYYIPVEYPYKKRRDMLLSNYYFHCECSRCLTEAQLPKTPILEELENFLSMPPVDSWWDTALKVLPYFSHIPITNYYHHALLKKLQKSFSNLKCYEEASSFGYLALKGCTTVNERKRVLFQLCHDMANSGSNNPRNKGYPMFQHVQSMTHALLTDIFHRHHPLVRSIQKLSSRKRIKMFDI